MNDEQHLEHFWFTNSKTITSARLGLFCHLRLFYANQLSCCDCCFECNLKQSSNWSKRREDLSPFFTHLSWHGRYWNTGFVLQNILEISPSYRWQALLLKWRLAKQPELIAHFGICWLYRLPIALCRVVSVSSESLSLSWIDWEKANNRTPFFVLLALIDCCFYYRNRLAHLSVCLVYDSSSMIQSIAFSIHHGDECLLLVWRKEKSNARVQSTNVRGCWAVRVGNSINKSKHTVQSRDACLHSRRIPRESWVLRPIKLTTSIGCFVILILESLMGI